MKRGRMTGICIVAVLALGAITASGASATELLSSSATGSGEGVGGATELNGASKISCTNTTGTGVGETAHLGKGKLTFEKCTTQILGTHECTGTKPVAPKGDIIVEGVSHLGLARKTSTETPHAAVLSLIGSAVEFACAGVGTVRVTGSVISLLQTKTGAPLEPPDNFLGAVAVTRATGTKQEDKEFLLSLTTPENEVMTKVELSCEIFGISGECAEVGSGESTKVTPEGVHLVTG